MSDHLLSTKSYAYALIVIRRKKCKHTNFSILHVVYSGVPRFFLNRHVFTYENKYGFLTRPVCFWIF